MAKIQPPNTVGRQIYLPADLHRKIKALTAHGEADDLIIHCLTESIGRRYKQLIEKEHSKINKD
jgi:hypothetical protein